MRHTFHEATVAHEGVGVVIDDGVTIAIEFSGQQFFVDGHAYGVGDPLTQWAGRGFNARRVTIFRVAWCAAVQLAELLEVFDGQIVATQME